MVFLHPGKLFESYCYKARGEKVFGDSAKHLRCVFYNKSHIWEREADALAQGTGFQSVLTSCLLSHPLFSHKGIESA